MTVENLRMAPVKKPVPRRTRTYLREWRIYKELSLEAAAERLDIHHTTLSRIERGISPYDQDLLERAKLAYGAEDTSDFLTINPLSEMDGPHLVWSQIKKAPAEIQRRAAAIIQALIKAG